MNWKAALFAIAVASAGCSQRDAPGAAPPPTGASTGPGAAMDSFYSFSAIPLGASEAVALSRYKGKVILVVNTASHCGYTPQYAPLGEVARKYEGKGLQVLGFVSDDFGKQAGTVEEVKSCSLEYKATFDQFAEIKVKKGAGQHPLFAWLTSQPAFPGDVAWNFNKWLIGKSGELLGRWPSNAAPDGPEITKAVEGALGQ